MPATSTRRQTRASTDRLLSAQEGAALTGYTVDYFRRMKPGFPAVWIKSAPPFTKVGGRHLIWRSDLASWAADHGIVLADELAS